MVYAEKRWLLCIIMSVMLALTMLAAPVTVLAAEGDGAYGSPYAFTNSDGQKVDAYEKDGYVYQIVNSDGTEAKPNMVAKVYGYTKATGEDSLTIPESIDIDGNPYPVVSVAIDPRYPVAGEKYDSVTSISLPEQLQYHHYLRFFDKLQAVKVAEENALYKSDKYGVLYTKYDEGCSVELYPRGKTETSWVMDEDVNELYTFYEGCPLEDVTVSKKAGVYWEDAFGKLTNLKAIIVPEANPDYASEDGVLFNKDKTTLYKYPAAKAGDAYVVPEGVEQIGYEAFANVQNLKKLTLPTTIGGIGPDAFDQVTLIQEVEFTSAKAPEEYSDYESLRDYMMEHSVDVKTPSDGTGYENFVAWLKGAEKNEWRQYPRASSYFYTVGGNNISITAEAAYGTDTINITYAASQEGPFAEEQPTTVGKYYAKVSVKPTEEYTGLEELVEYEIIKQEINPKTNKATNSINVGWVGTYYGDEYALDVCSQFGTPVILYKSATDENAEWTDKRPTAVGKYYCKATVKETDDYEGAVYDSSEESNICVEIYKAGVDLYIDCDDVFEGETIDPQIKAEFWVGFDETVDLENLNLNYTYEQWVTNEDGTKEWQALSAAPTAPGRYRITVSKEETDTCEFYRDRAKYSIKVNKADVNDFAAKVDALPDPVTLANESAVKEARTLYDGMTANQKALVSEETMAKLEKAEATIKQLKQQSSGGGSTGGGGGGGAAPAEEPAAEPTPITGSDSPVAVSAVVENGEATVAPITEKDLEKVSEGDTIALDVTASNTGGTGTAREEVTSITIPRDTVKNIADSPAEAVEIKLDTATATIDDKTMDALAKNAEGENVTLEVEKDQKAEASLNQTQKETVKELNKHIIFEATFTSGGKKITDFGGGTVIIRIAFSTDLSVRAWFLMDNGDKEATPCTYDGTFAILTLSHFSHYAVEEYELAANKMTVKALTKKTKPVTVKAVKVKKANQKVAVKKLMTVKKAKGTVTYKMVSGKKSFKVNKKTGKLTVKKGTKKGTYKVKIKVSAAGNDSYLPAKKTVTCWIRIK